MKNTSKLFLLLVLVLLNFSLLKAQCTASFMYIDNGGGNISFSSTTTGTGVVYNNWDFNNGPGSTGFTIDNDTISYPYIISGSYNVQLVTQDSITGCSDTTVQTITIANANPCIASFTYAVNGLSINLSSTSTSDSSAIINYWNFGDGNNTSSNNTIMSHNYLTNGAYIVSLAMVDTLSGCSDTTYQTMNITTGCGTPNFSYIDNTDGSVSFMNSSTNAVSYLWDFGNGNTSTQTSPTFYFQPAGVYSVCLTINDTCANVFCDSVTVTDTVGTACSGAANFTFIDNGGGSISFTNNSAVPTNYSWNFGNGSNGSSQASPTYTYATDGSYLVSLAISDSLTQCTESYSQVLVVSGAANICNLVSSFNITDNGNGNWSFTSTSNGLPTAYSWNFGDGVQGSGQMPNHVYNADGIYVVALTVFDSILGCSNSSNTIISVFGASGGNPCNAAFVVTYDSLLSTVLVYNTATGVNLNYYWEFGDGNSSTQQNPNYSYAGSGPYGLCLTVDDGNGCTSTYCDSIFAGGTVLKQAGFSIAITRPIITSLSQNNIALSDLTLYPNPVKDNLTIDFVMQKTQNIEIFVTDILGNKIAIIAYQKMIAGVNQTKWNTASLKNGIYLLNVKEENAFQIKKFVVNR